MQDTDIASGTCGGCDWKITSAGELVITKTTGGTGKLADVASGTFWLANADSIKTATIGVGVSTGSAAAIFDGCWNLSGINGLMNLDTSNTIDMANMFYECSSLTFLDLSSLDTSKVTAMTDMFEGCTNLKTVTLGSKFSFKGSGSTVLTTLNESFAWYLTNSSENYNSIYVAELSSVEGTWNAIPSIGMAAIDIGTTVYPHTGSTVMPVPTVKYGFYSDRLSFGIDYEYFYTTASGTTVESPTEVGTYYVVVKGIGEYGGTAKIEFTIADASGKCGGCDWSIDDNGKLTIAPSSGTTGELASITDPDNSESAKYWLIFEDTITSTEIKSGVSAGAAAALFCGCSDLTDITGLTNLTTSGTTDMNYMFHNCYQLTSVDLSSFDTSKVESMTGMFDNCSSLKTVKLGSSFTFKGSSKGTEAAKTLTTMDDSIIDEGRSTPVLWRLSDVDYKAAEMAALDNVEGTWSCVIDIDGCYSAGQSIYAYAASAVKPTPELYIHDWGEMRTGPLTSGTDYQYSYTAADGTAVESPIEVGDYYVTVKGIGKCGGTKKIPFAIVATSGTCGDCEWSIAEGKVTISPSNGISGKLASVSHEEGAGPTQYWLVFKDYITSVEIEPGVSAGESAAFFENCGQLATITGLANLTTSSTTDMSYMFFDCSSITSLDLSNFDTSKATSMNGMFENCSSLKTVALGPDFSFRGINKGTETAEALTRLPYTVLWRLAGTNTDYDASSMATRTSVEGTWIAVPSMPWVNPEIDSSVYPHTGSAVKPVPFASYNGMPLASGTDFTYSYTTSEGVAIDSPTAVGSYKVIVKGIGAYGGTKEIDFDIVETSGTCGGCDWSINNGKLVIAKTNGGNGILNNIAKANDSWLLLKDYITSAEIGQGVCTGAKAGLFSGCSKLETISGLENLTTSGAMDMSSMFYGCSSLTSLDLSGFTISSATNTDSMFGFCNALTKVTLGSGFHFKGDSSNLPEPNPYFIENATGKWVSSEGAVYTPAEIAARGAVADTYTAQTIDTGKPGVPTGLSAAPKKDSSAITLGWTAPAKTGTGAFKGYNIYRGNPISGYVKLNGDTPVADTAYIDNTAVAGTSYTYFITAVNESGESLDSSAVTVVSSSVTTSLAGATVTAGAQTYTGSALKPALTVTLNGTTLVKGTDYTVSYANNVNAGTATIVVTGIGNYEGTATGTFDINKAVLTAKYAGESVVYGSTPALAVAVTGFVNGESAATAAGYSAPSIASAPTTIGPHALTPAGGAAANYSFTYVAGNLTIGAVPLAGASVSAAGQTYTGSALTPAPTVILNGATLAAGTDYTVSYVNNVDVGTATVTVTGIGNYAGIATGTFTIAAAATGTTLTSGTQSYAVTSPGAVAFTGVTSKSATVTIPASITVGGSTYAVTSIAASAFKNNKTIKTVNIGANITSIGANAFSGCTKLTKVNATSTKLTSVGDKAFYKCTALKTVTLKSKSLKSIGKQAFYGCKKLATLKIYSSKVKTVGAKAFTGVNTKAKIYVPKAKMKSYTKLFQKAGLSKKVAIKKI